MRRLLRLVLILVIAVTLAAMASAGHPRSIPWFVPKDRIYPPPTAQQRAADIGRQQVVDGLEQGVVIIDARNPDRYAEGHIPGSVNIPADNGHEQLARMSELALPQDRLIVYCGGDTCDESRVLFERLVAMGFTHVQIYAGGWRDWTDHDMPIER